MMNTDVLFFFEEHPDALPLYEELEKRRDVVRFPFIEQNNISSKSQTQN